MVDQPSLARAVFTSKQVTDEGFWIQFVFHDEDDTWQAHSMDGAPDDLEDSRIIRYDTLVSVDNSILQLSDLPRGWRAWRLHVDAPWQRCENLRRER